jgi:hypothetical protein
VIHPPILHMVITLSFIRKMNKKMLHRIKKTWMKNVSNLHISADISLSNFSITSFFISFAQSRL